MNDLVQLLIDAGAIPSAPFVSQSRYCNVPLAVLQQRPDAPGLPYVRRRFIPPLSEFLIEGRHAVRSLERPDSLSATYLGDPLLYWRIADANAVVDPNELTDAPGRRIVIPGPPGT